jgi:succinate dehydrogenase/fumarate reductase flavoprotein subunit
MRIKIDNMGDETGGTVLVTTENAEEAREDQTVHGSRWEFDNDFAYAIISEEPDLVQKLTNQGYEVDDSEYFPTNKECVD